MMPIHLGWFDMETMMTFKRLSSLTQDPSVVLTSLSKSPQDLLQASDIAVSHYFNYINYSRSKIGAMEEVEFVGIQATRCPNSTKRGELPCRRVQ